MNQQLIPIAYVHSPFREKFGIPRQSGLSPSLRSTIVFTPEFANPDALRGLEDFSHIWLIWGFSANRTVPSKDAAGAKGTSVAKDSAVAKDTAVTKDAAGAKNTPTAWRPTVRPPRLGGNRRMGVFATRSPYRPNPIGLSSVKIEEIKKDPVLGLSIVVSGADLMDGTPIYDIKPYITNDIHTDALCGFQEAVPFSELTVDFPDHLLALIPAALQSGLLEILHQDPRPSYQEDSARVYGLAFDGFDIRFRVAQGTLTVVDVVPTSG